MFKWEKARRVYQSRQAVRKVVGQTNPSIRSHVSGRKERYFLQLAIARMYCFAIANETKRARKDSPHT